MPPLHRQANLANVPTQTLAAELNHRFYQYMWNADSRQYMFARAMELYNRPNATPEHRTLVRRALGAIATLGSMWENNRLPYARFINNNFNSENNSNRNNSNGNNSNRNNSNGNNSNRNNSNGNYSKVRKFAERWRFKGPVKLVNLPANKNNRTDPVSLHVFRAGQEAIQHQRRNAEGRIISTRYYLLPTIERLAGKNWKTIRRMHPNKVLVKGSGPGNKFVATKHVPNVITRLPIYRKHLTLVKFKSTS
jgi:hypothetical protein